MSLPKILQLMGYNVTTDFSVTDLNDGNGPFISHWDHVDTQPTQTEINDFETAYLAHADRLIEKKTEAKYPVDLAAENSRNKYLTTGSGQAISYLRKEDDAEKYKADGYPVIGSPSEYPWITAEVNATGLSAQEAADAILAQRDAWLTLGTKIEEERRLGKLAIDAASDESEVNTARDNAVATLEAL